MAKLHINFPGNFERLVHFTGEACTLSGMDSATNIKKPDAGWGCVN